MPTIVTAKTGDCLCGIAVDAGFLNCEPLRALPENSAFLDRPLAAGDQVTVPDRVVEESSKPVDAKHSFTLKSSPPFNIRIVHGSPDLPYRDDADVNVLHVSNFVTDKGGATGLTAFPTGYGYNADGHADLDTFKVEVWDPAAGASVNVKLEALKPVYTAGPDGKLSVTSYVPFTDATRRIDALVCNKVSDAAANTFRSKYMRLVVDEADRDAVAGQTLFVSDLADGLGTGLPGDNDTVEILDQVVRASYEIQRCTGSTKCKVTKTVEIGGSDRRRIPLFFYAFRGAVGGANSPNGVAMADLEKHLRRRTFKWYRRLLAQADISPRFAGITLLDPPPENMLCLSHNHGRGVATTTIHTLTSWMPAWASVPLQRMASTYQLSFRITTSAGADLPVQVPFLGGETPLQAGELITTMLPPGYSGEALPCVQAVGAVNPAADVIITADNGDRVTLLDVQLTAGAGLTVDVPRVNLMSVTSDDAAMDSSIAFLTPDFKRILRMIPVTDDAMHCVVVGQFSGPSLRGQAFLECNSFTGNFKPFLPFRAATIMAYTSASGAVLDNGDNLPYTSPHESAHTLTDLIHTKPQTNHSRTELLASGTSTANTVTSTKRLCDGPYTIEMQQNTPTGLLIVPVKPCEVLRTNGANKLESW